MADDEAASVLELLRAVRSCTSSAGDVGVETAGRFDLRKRGITKVDGYIKLILV
jgi:hypothetical protein